MYRQQKTGGGYGSGFQKRSSAPEPSLGCALSSALTHRKDKKVRAIGSQSQGSVTEGSFYPTFGKCCRNYPGKRLYGKDKCFGCGQLDHGLIEYPFSSQSGGVGGGAQSMSSAASSGKNGQKGNSSKLGSGKGQNYLYVLVSPQYQEDSLDVILV